MYSEHIRKSFEKQHCLLNITGIVSYKSRICWPQPSIHNLSLKTEATVACVDLFALNTRGTSLRLPSRHMASYLQHTLMQGAFSKMPKHAGPQLKLPQVRPPQGQIQGWGSHGWKERRGKWLDMTLGGGDRDVSNQEWGHPTRCWTHHTVAAFYMYILYLLPHTVCPSLCSSIKDSLLGVHSTQKPPTIIYVFSSSSPPYPLFHISHTAWASHKLFLQGHKSVSCAS